MSKKSKIVWAGIFAAGLISMGLFQNCGVSQFTTAVTDSQSSNAPNDTSGIPPVIEQDYPPADPHGSTDGGFPTGSSAELKQKQTALLLILNE